MIRAINKIVTTKGDKMNVGDVKKLVKAFQDKKQAEAEAEAKKAEGPVLEK